MKKPQTHDAIRWTLTLIWVVGLVVLLGTGRDGPPLGLWVLIGVVVGLLLALWQRAHREPPIPPGPRF